MLSLVKRYVSTSTWLIFATVLALVCANSPLKEWYFGLWQHEVSLSFGDFNFFSHHGQSFTFAQLINDFLMAIFFLSVGLEIKREIRVGELSTREKALVSLKSQLDTFEEEGLLTNKFENGFRHREAWSVGGVNAAPQRNTEAANVLGGSFSKDGNRGNR